MGKDRLRIDAERIISGAIRAVMPGEAVIRALRQTQLYGEITLIAAGKAAWSMASAAVNELGDRIRKGIVCTKYGHVMGNLPHCVCFEGGHPVPDENCFLGTEAAIRAVEGLTENDTVLFLLSGGGSALFEKPLIPGDELADITGQLLACGADIIQINTIRKRLSAVKGGRFAQLCAPAQVFSVVLSDVLGDPLDMIASGPAVPDASTCQQACAIAQKYHLRMSDEAMRLLTHETPKQLPYVQSVITGSVRELCRAAADTCKELGYRPLILTELLCCQASEVGSMMASILRSHHADGEKLAFIAGGQTVVRLTGSGLGGRNQQLALSCADGIAGLTNTALFSIGSDGTDGPTDAAGGYVDGNTRAQLLSFGIRIPDVLRQNDSYHALKKTDGLIITGPTGTNVNDIAVGLIDPDLL